MRYFNLSIKKPAEPAYDVVSNNNDWIKCKSANANQEISTSGITNPDDVEKANRFYCYQEGNHWSWAECQDPDERVPTPNNGMKERAPGDGLFGLKIDPAIAEEMAATGREYLYIDLEQSFLPFYGDSRIDFAGFDPLYFQFLVRFKNIEENSIPQLQLTIHGPEPGEGVERIVYYDQPVLGYALNTPLLEANRWIQVKVPLPSEMLEVEAINIKSIPPDNLIEVKNIYLSSGESRLCSGTRSHAPGDSSWIQEARR